MNASKTNLDQNQSVNTTFVFSLPLSPFEDVETKVAIVDRKRKATWEDGGITKKKRLHWETQAKKQLFNDKKKINCSFKKIKQAKALHQGIKRIDGRGLPSASGSTDDEVLCCDIPSKRGNTHGKIKIIISPENDRPSKKAKKTNWSVSTIPLQFKEVLVNVVKSITRFSVSPKVNINNNSIPYPSTSSMNKIKSKWVEI